MIQYVNKNCPHCGGYMTLSVLGYEVCENCGHVPDSTTSTSSNSLGLCGRCGVALQEWGNLKVCPRCRYGYLLEIGDLPDDITIPNIYNDGNWAVGRIADVDPMAPNTLTITNCEKFKVQLREIDIEFELDPDKLENIDTIIINGHKYVKEK